MPVPTDYEFDFASTFALAPASEDSLILDGSFDALVTTRDYGTFVSTFAYPNGTAIISGIPQPADLYFIEGIKTAAVTEPTSLVLLAVSLAAFGMTRRREKP